MASSIPKEFIEFLRKPESWPHGPERVEHIQTHISHVFIVSPYVYKFKKPLDLEFLDFSTLEKRKYYCEREVELNRRLCPEIYLGVVPVYRLHGSFSFEPPGEEDPEPFEYAVRMKQLNPEFFLKEFVRRGQLTTEHLDRVAKKLAGFYNDQKPDESIRKWGSVNKIRENIEENFRQTEPFVGGTIDRETFQSIRSFNELALEQLQTLFEKRIRENRIVDGHGDLHLEHIHLTENRLCIYDCIEFNDRFRYQDIAADIAFLAMDLDFNGLKNESDYFIERISELLDDPDLLHLIDFYACYRAYVRGKVNSIESDEEEVEPRERRQAAELARRYYSLSLNYALIGGEPIVLLFMGRVASGKSTLAEQVAERLIAEHQSSDTARKKWAGLPLSSRTPPKQRSDLYSKKMTDDVYSLLANRAIEAYKNKQNICLDATFGDPGRRRKLIETFDTAGVQYLFIETAATDSTRIERLKKRETDDDTISDARLEDLEKLDRNYSPPLEIDPGRLIRVGTDQPLDKTLTQLFQALIRNNLSSKSFDA